jgi:hypothetical protein
MSNERIFVSKTTIVYFIYKLMCRRGTLANGVNNMKNDVNKNYAKVLLSFSQTRVALLRPRVKIRQICITQGIQNKCVSVKKGLN